MEILIQLIQIVDRESVIEPFLEQRMLPPEQ
jgi:hypothetical protein